MVRQHPVSMDHTEGEIAWPVPTSSMRALEPRGGQGVDRNSAPFGSSSCPQCMTSPLGRPPPSHPEPDTVGRAHPSTQRLAPSVQDHSPPPTGQALPPWASPDHRRLASASQETMDKDPLD